MFLTQRSVQQEYLDTPGLSLAEVRNNYWQLARVNRVCCFEDPFQRVLARWLGRDRCRSLSLLDLGAGDGSLGRAVTTWASRQGWAWRVTNVEINPLALRLNGAGLNVAGSATRLPFRDRSFDVVIASQMTHHLPDDATVVEHFREGWRVTRDALFLTDVHRNVGLFAVVWGLIRLLGLREPFRRDGLMSVRRGWRVREWRALAERAGIVSPQVRLYWGARIMLQARKRTATGGYRELL